MSKGVIKMEKMELSIKECNLICASQNWILKSTYFKILK